MELIREAYGYSNRPAIDVTGPGWIDIERFDIASKAELPGAYNVTMSAFVVVGVANANADDPWSSAWSGPTEN